jgi:2-amino-4-hydroxy-6-hydroxymethyldihydropteridine diphosphokinase
VGGPAQPDYYNAGVRVAFEGDAHELLASLHAIEAAHGRQREEHWGPRTPDLDLLWIAGFRVASAELTVPHARLAERAFALLPLVDLVPNAKDHASGERFEAILGRLGSAGVRPVTEPDWESLRAAIAPS